MKLGIVSVLIGIIGLVVITYFTYQVNLEYQQLGESGDVVIRTAMSATAAMTLFLFETAGVALGVVSYKRSKRYVGLFGMGLCALNLILLYAHMYTTNMYG